jgi:hypothetical protein
VSLLETIINRLRGRKPADSPVVCAVADDGSAPEVSPGELSPLRADPSTGAVRVTTVASEGGATPELVEPGDADANIPAVPTAARIQAIDAITGNWATVQQSSDPGLVLGDKRGLHVYVLGGEIITTPAQQFLLTSPPLAARSARFLRLGGLVPRNQPTTRAPRTSARLVSPRPISTLAASQSMTLTRYQRTTRPRTRRCHRS